jgi:hypothetical protein
VRRQLNCKTDPSMTQEKKDYPNETASMQFSIRSYVEETVLSFHRCLILVEAGQAI